MDYAVAIPTWGVGTGGTLFARCSRPWRTPETFMTSFPTAAWSSIFRAPLPMFHPHFQWDRVADYNALRQEAASHELGLTL